MTDSEFKLIRTNVKAFCRWVDSERREMVREAEAKARTARETEINKARQLDAEATALTQNIKRFF